MYTTTKSVHATDTIESITRTVARTTPTLAKINHKDEHVNEIWVSPLASGMNNTGLLSLFTPLGAKAAIVMTGRGGVHYGFVRFETKEACDYAEYMTNGMVIDGERICVRPSMLNAMWTRRVDDKGVAVFKSDGHARDIPRVTIDIGDVISKSIEKHFCIDDTKTRSDNNGHGDDDNNTGSLYTSSDVLPIDKALSTSAPMNAEAETKVASTTRPVEEPLLSKITLFIGNLPKNVTTDDIANAFSNFGIFPVAVRVVHNTAKRDRCHETIGFADFDDFEIAKRARMLMNGTTISGQVVRVSFDKKTAAAVFGSFGAFQQTQKRACLLSGVETC